MCFLKLADYCHVISWAIGRKQHEVGRDSDHCCGAMQCIALVMKNALIMTYILHTVAYTPMYKVTSLTCFLVYYVTFPPHYNQGSQIITPINNQIFLSHPS